MEHRSPSDKRRSYRRTSGAKHTKWNDTDPHDHINLQEIVHLRTSIRPPPSFWD